MRKLFTKEVIKEIKAIGIIRIAAETIILISLILFIITSRPISKAIRVKVMKITASTSEIQIRVMEISQ
jgi:hypothetical protein